MTDDRADDLAAGLLLLRRFTADDLDDLAALHGDAAVLRRIDDGRPVAREVVAEQTLPGILAQYAQLPAGRDGGGEIVLGTARIRSRVGLVATGEFWCPYCEADRGYQQREWRSALIKGRRGGIFVRCDSCESVLSPECLDESSTKLCDELMITAPGFAWEPSVVEDWSAGPTGEAPR